MQPLETFSWAAAGFAVGEVVTCYLSLRQAGCMPKCWNRPLYFVIAVMVALCAGAFAVVMDLETKKQAFFAGMACPFVIQRFMAEQAVPTPPRRRRAS